MSARQRSWGASHKLVCLVLAQDLFTACALLEFAEAPTHILRVLYSGDKGITTATSPDLDIAALCLSSWPAATVILMLSVISPQISRPILSTADCDHLHASYLGPVCSLLPCTYM